MAILFTDLSVILSVFLELVFVEVADFTVG